MLQRPPHLDLVEHLKFLHKQVLPLFFIFCALAMLGFIVIRAGQQGVDLPAPGSEPDRVGLLRAGKAVDPAFDLLGPVEMVLAPGAGSFVDPFEVSPALSGAGPGAPQVIRAATDGLVVAASSGPAEAGVVLLHDRADGVVETVYEGLASIRVGVGIPVRRGDPLGTVPDRGALDFRVRGAPVLAVQTMPGEKTTLPEAWLAPADQIAPPPAGEAIEPGALKLQEAPAKAK